MSPRFPQELFDHIIDYAEDDDNALKTYSTVCKRWTARSHSHLFNLLCIWEPADLDRWCEGIPPTIDGPSKYVKDLYVCVGTIPFVGEPQSLDPYLDHLSAFTRVVDLTLVGDDVKVHLDTAFQGFSAFRDTLRRLKLQSTSFRFEEVSRIVEFFPNLLALMMLSPMSLPSDKMGEFPPHQRATFPKLQGLEFRPCSKSQPLDHDLLSGFAEASMDLQCLSVVGEVSDPSAVKQLVESSAHSLLELEVSSFELDLTACENIQYLGVHDLLHSYYGSLYLHDSHTKPQFERVLSTIQSPSLLTIVVPIKDHIPTGEDEDEDDNLPPQNDWSGVDASLCDLLTRVRGRARDPLWKFEMRIMGCRLTYYHKPAHSGRFLPDFQAMGGIVLFSSSLFE